MMRLPPRSLGVTRRYARVPRDGVPQARVQHDRPRPRAPQDWRDSPRSSRNIPTPSDDYRGRARSRYPFGDYALPVHADKTIASRVTSRSGLLIALAAVMLVVSAFAAFSLIRGIASQKGANGPLLEMVTTATDVPYVGLVATATAYALTPTVTTGPRTPTPTPRPPVPTPTSVLTPTRTPAPGTPTLPPPTPTATNTPLPTATPPPTDTPTPTDTPPPTP
jgi:hypothetical protein